MQTENLNSCGITRDRCTCMVVLRSALYSSRKMSGHDMHRFGFYASVKSVRSNVMFTSVWVLLDWHYES